MTRAVLGVIGGSGVYEFDGLEDVENVQVETPWGKPSGAIVTGQLNGLRMAFLPRHGAGHVLPPSDINYRANIAAMKQLGVTDLISVSACGSFREELRPGMFVIVDQFIDRTFAREKSFFGPGCVAHVSMADPVSPTLASRIAEAATEEGVEHVVGGTYLVMEGPQFSTRAESEMYRAWGCDVIGMTNMPEAKLAREAEICYASVAMVTDFDCWHESHQDVHITEILKVLRGNVQKAQGLLRNIALNFPAEHPPCDNGSDQALEIAILTPPEARDPEMLKKLQTIAGRVLNKDQHG